MSPMRHWLICVLSSLLLQGCLLTRILETTAQLCETQPPQVVVMRQPGTGVRVVFRTPTLTDRDVVTIIGYNPSATWDSESVRKLLYEALPLHSALDRATGLVLRLSFTPIGDEYRLAELEIPEEFNAILPPQVIDAAIAVACQPKLTVFPPSAEFSLASVDRTTLPMRDQLRQLLGSPPVELPQVNEMSYEYCLSPCDLRTARIAYLGFTFGNSGELHRIKARYFRYSVNVDFIAPEPKALITLD